MHRICALALTAGLSLAAAAPAQEEGGEFARSTIDLGVVVSDLDRAAKFYTAAIGFKEVEGFSVPADFCAKAGLTDSKALKIRVFVLGEGDSATKLKLMELPGVESKKADNTFIHSQLGYSYLTIYVADINAALKRLKQAGVEPVSKGGAVELPEDLARGVYLTLVKDPDGNIIELIGPKKE
ncbi:MAG TPA: VOC family protein [Gemmataceae bacterium]